jgi:hypothetical protein
MNGIDKKQKRESNAKSLSLPTFNPAALHPRVT